jgi:hypothetical protein
MYRKTIVAVVLLFAAFPTEATQAPAREAVIPEFVITRPANDYCEFVVTIPPTQLGSPQNRLFDFMEAASRHTDGWRRGFAIVGVDHVTGTLFHLLSFRNCSRSQSAIDFVTQFFELWQQRHCDKRCNLTKPRVTVQEGLVFAISSENYTYKSQIDEFLHFHEKDSLQRCTIEIALARQVAQNFAHSRLFGALVELETQYRFPIMDISQIDGKLYFLLSRQCPQKEALYSEMLRNLSRQGVDSAPLRSVNFHPDVSDYIFSQTGQR